MERRMPKCLTEIHWVVLGGVTDKATVLYPLSYAAPLWSSPKNDKNLL